MTNQNCIASSHNNKIMNSKQGNRRPIFIKNDVVGGIDRNDRAVGGVSLSILLEVIRYRSPASDVVPIEAGFDHQPPLCFFHNCVIE